MDGDGTGAEHYRNAARSEALHLLPDPTDKFTTWIDVFLWTDRSMRRPGMRAKRFRRYWGGWDAFRAGTLPKGRTPRTFP